MQESVGGNFEGDNVNFSGTDNIDTNGGLTLAENTIQGGIQRIRAGHKRRTCVCV